METKISYKNPDVLSFYKELPFNFYSSVENQAQAVRDFNSLSSLVVIEPILEDGYKVLDVGCGAGWFSNSVAHYHNCEVKGIDFNPKVVERSNAVAKELDVNASFECADLFVYDPGMKFDLVNSIGVLHHTDNCIEGIKAISEHVKLGGYFHIGLYHTYARRPFLDYFETLKEQGLDEEALYERYKALHQSTDDQHIRSWFRDQVLHPHETQHTVEEVAPVLEALGMEILACSINGFDEFESLDEIIEMEKDLAEVGHERLEQKTYYPGFFNILAEKVQ